MSVDKNIQKTKICPFCSEEIKLDAVKCRYCGEFLNKELKKSERINPEENLPIKKDRQSLNGIFAAIFVIIMIGFPSFLGLGGIIPSMVAGIFAGLWVWVIDKLPGMQWQKVLILILTISLTYGLTTVLLNNTNLFQQINISKGDNKLNDCLDTAKNQYRLNWDKQCSDTNQNDSCKLPTATAQLLEDRLNSGKQECYYKFGSK
ncbi:MAG: hypothetical protein ABI721_04195 [Candidatus Dojkabacteria bacterium]